MTVRMGAKGQVVVPKAIRDAAGLHPGAEVAFDFRDGEVVLVAAAGPGRDLLGGRFAGSDMLAEHEAEHAREVEQDRR
jgi:AbrB family looped-hinge helix DNA binding protein